MKKDERLEFLCEEFAGLDEAEKDYILEVSLTLACSVFEKGITFIPVAKTAFAGGKNYQPYRLEIS